MTDRQTDRRTVGPQEPSVDNTEDSKASVNDFLLDQDKVGEIEPDRIQLDPAKPDPDPAPVQGSGSGSVQALGGNHESAQNLAVTGDTKHKADSLKALFWL